jgi:hypothetical protein
MPTKSSTAVLADINVPGWSPSSRCVSADAGDEVRAIAARVPETTRDARTQVRMFAAMP